MFILFHGLGDRINFFPSCGNVRQVLVRGPKNAREAVKHFGKAPGVTQPHKALHKGRMLLKQ